MNSKPCKITYGKCEAKVDGPRVGLGGNLGQTQKDRWMMLVKIAGRTL